MKEKITIICGPTASGKSSFAQKLAQKKNAVIINADSLQVYKELPLLTAQPTEKDQQEIPHKLYAFLNPFEPFSVAKWMACITQEIKKAKEENKIPILVGGTGFYIKALTEGLSPIPIIPPSIREEIEQTQKKKGIDFLYKKLQKQDPTVALKLMPTDTQRIIRALEVIQETGQSISYWQSQPKIQPLEDRFQTILILPPRKELYQNCDIRFEKMIQQGALEEVKNFIKKYPLYPQQKNQGVTKAIGFEQLTDFIEGRVSLEHAIEKAKTLTRNYAKRQITWFKHQIKADEIIEKNA